MGWCASGRKALSATCNNRAARDVRRPAEFQGAVRAGVGITPGIDMTDQMFLVMTLISERQRAAFLTGADQ
jgi:hypothetical protein